MSMYEGSLRYAAGASGTVTLQAGDRIVAIRAQSSLATGTVAIFGGTAIPVVGAVAPDTKTLDLNFPNHEAQHQATESAKTVVFTDTVSYYVAYRRYRNPVT